MDVALSEERCGGHDALAEELRAHAAGVLNLLEPWLKQIREAPPPEGGTPVTCASCPLCALMALLRGERSEMAVRVAEQAAGLVAVLRAALAEGNGPGPSTGEPADAHDSHAPALADDGRDVQRIPISRVDGGAASSHC